MAVIVVICLAVLIALKDTSKPSPTSFAESLTAFNRYANYILYGENSDSDIEGSYHRWDTYELNRQLDQDNSNYWETALSMLDNSIVLYPKDVESAAFSNLQNYQRNFQFFIKYRELKEPTAESVFDAYRASGKNVAEEDIKNFYTERLAPISTSAQDYADAKLAQYQALIDYLDLYNDMGCLNTEGVDLLCTNIDIQRALELQEKISSEAYEAELIIQDLERTIVSDCWQISNQLRALIEDKE